MNSKQQIVSQAASQLVSVDVPMRPKMSRMLGTKMTSRLTMKRRQMAMQMCLAQWKGFSGNSSSSRALRIWGGRENKTRGFVRVELHY